MNNTFLNSLRLNAFNLIKANNLGIRAANHNLIKHLMRLHFPNPQIEADDILIHGHICEPVANIRDAVPVRAAHARRVRVALNVVPSFASFAELELDARTNILPGNFYNLSFKISS